MSTVAISLTFMMSCLGIIANCIIFVLVILTKQVRKIEIVGNYFSYYFLRRKTDFSMHNNALLYIEPPSYSHKVLMLQLRV